jgi:hypothetical protein
VDLEPDDRLPPLTGRGGARPRIICHHRPHPLTVASSAPK